MSNIVELPFQRLSDGELQIRAWEALMADGYGSPEHRRIEQEQRRRMSVGDTVRPFQRH